MGAAHPHWRRFTKPNIKIQDVDAATHVHTDPTKCLIASENVKKKKYQDKCKQVWRDFVPFVVSVDGLLAPEAVNTLKCIAQLLREKWCRPYSTTFGYVKSRVSISVVQTSNLCLHGTHIKNQTFDALG